MVSIYTKKGDRGKTNLCDGLRVGKDDLRIEVIGSLDELNSVLGVVKSLNVVEKIRDNLTVIQIDIMSLCSCLAHFNRDSFDRSRVQQMEKIIDDITSELPPLKGFLVPGDNIVESYLHLARAVCRRAERNLVRLSGKEKVSSHFIKYLNRLADLLFSLAYWCQKKF